MAKAKMYGSKSVGVPNREADMRRRNNTFWKSREFTENDLQRSRKRRERKIRKEMVDNVQS